MRRYLRTLVSILRVQRNTGKPWAQFPHPKNFYELLLTWERGLATSGEFSQDENNSINAVISKLSVFKQARQGQHPKYEFTKTEVDELLGLIQTAHSAFGGSDTDTLPIDADIPREFTGEQLLRSVEQMLKYSTYQIMLKPCLYAFALFFLTTEYEIYLAETLQFR